MPAAASSDTAVGSSAARTSFTCSVCLRCSNCRSTTAFCAPPSAASAAARSSSVPAASTCENHVTRLWLARGRNASYLALCLFHPLLRLLQLRLVMRQLSLELRQGLGQ